MNKSILILSKFDSFTNHAMQIASLFREYAFDVAHCLITTKNINTLSPRMYATLGISKDTKSYTIQELFDKVDLLKFSFVYLALTGGSIREFLFIFKEYCKNKEARPLIITGFTGIVLRNRLTSFINHSGCDFILFNSKYELRAYCDFCIRYGLNSYGSALFGYMFPYYEYKQKGQIKTVLFVEQAVIPETFVDRSYLVQRLVLYAQKFPFRIVIIKPRLLPGEQSVFTTKFHFEKILASYAQLPSNICIDYSNINSLLQKADLCLTVSSTVALQAMWYGIPTGIIKDFGCCDEFGIDFFKESNCLVSFDELDENVVPKLNEVWFREHFADHKAHLLVFNKIESSYQERLNSSNWQDNGNLDKIFGEKYKNFYLNYKKHKKIRSIISRIWNILRK